MKLCDLKIISPLGGYGSDIIAQKSGFVTWLYFYCVACGQGFLFIPRIPVQQFFHSYPSSKSVIEFKILIKTFFEKTLDSDRTS